MNEMVDRVARQLIVPLGYDRAVDWERAWVGNNMDTPETGSLAHLCRTLARAAIEAMVPATEAMIEAGYTALYDKTGEYSKEDPHDEAGYEIHWEAWVAPRVFVSMIDTALKD